jgi:predicted neuraminidase
MLRAHLLLPSFLILILVSGCSEAARSQPDADSGANDSLVVLSEFIYEEAPFPSAHASTIAETPAGLAAAWFGGTAERDPDVGIWFSHKVGESWTAPAEVANGVQPNGTRFPSWNPVLFQPVDGPLVLFYKVGPNPREWWGLVRTSTDNGQTWSEEARLPDGILGPIRAKPVLLSDGSLLAGSSTEHEGWVVHMERLLKPAGDQSMWDLAYLSSPASWQTIGPLNDAETFGAIQPTLLVHSEEQLQMLCRSRQGVITEAWSSDGGLSWAPMTATGLPNPSAGIDALRLADGRFLLIYNPTTEGRERLGLALSTDGKAWEPVTLLEDQEGEYSYPAMIQASDGSIHITYTWRRERIKHVVVGAGLIP